MPRPIKIVVSVDWEGRDLVPESIEAMEAFRRNYPEIPMQQFLNAAYYTKASADAAQISHGIRRTLLEKDCLGLHIHAWQSLCQAAGVSPRRSPNFRDGTDELRLADGDWGHEVSIDAFSKGELRKLIAKSMAILANHGFACVKEFRSGAWLSGKSVREALLAEDFYLDASALNRRFIKERWGQSPLYQRVSELWPDIDDLSQPYLQEEGSGSLWQCPNNGCLADYTSRDDIMSVYKALLQVAEAEDSDEPLFLSVGFHQETAHLYLQRLEAAIIDILAYAKDSPVPISFSASQWSQLKNK